MPRLPRVILPDIPHHIVQRGNRRQQTFFCDDDFRVYLDLMGRFCRASQVEVLAYCLMPNHVHLIAVPKTLEGMSKAIGEAHWHYSRRINFQRNWRGNLWQGRFRSFAMDDIYLKAAIRYVELNPVRARLCESPFQYQWSSAKAHLCGRDDELVSVRPMLDRFPDWSKFLGEPSSEEDFQSIRDHNSVGRPLGSADFLSLWESKTGRRLARRKPGPKCKLMDQIVP